jgi:hypothetical protein
LNKYKFINTSKKRKDLMNVIKDLKGFLESEIDVIESEMKDFGNKDSTEELKVLKDKLKFLNEYIQEFENKNKEVKK